jgi:alanine-alpha-ketoisovalerate/valine-pyruvate aminotransferase
MKAHRFKYRPDFSQLSITEDTGCVIFSRPCNPTGNVLTDEEVKKIAALAAPLNVPVLIDSAYAPPFSGVELYGNDADIWRQYPPLHEPFQSRATRRTDWCSDW